MIGLMTIDDGKDYLKKQAKKFGKLSARQYRKLHRKVYYKQEEHGRREEPTDPKELARLSDYLQSRGDLYNESPSGSIHKEQLHDALVQLGSSRKINVVKMKVLDKLTFKEIGDKLGLPESTIASEYYRSIDILKDFYTKRGFKPRGSDEPQDSRSS